LLKVSDDEEAEKKLQLRQIASQSRYRYAHRDSRGRTVTGNVAEEGTIEIELVSLSLIVITFERSRRHNRMQRKVMDSLRPIASI
jgi:hypothetical protein